MAIVYGANYGRPTLDLNFARNKSLIDTVSGQNLVTFSRAQANYLTTYVGADGLIKTASADEPRFDHDPVTGVCNGLLMEEQRTNLCSSSQNFGGSQWTEYTANVSITANQLDPAGGTTASLVTHTAGTSRHRLCEKISTTRVSRSFYVKKTNQRYIYIGDQNGGGYSPNYRFDLDTGTGAVIADSSSYNYGYSITKISNNFYRIWIDCISIDITQIVASNTLATSGGGTNPLQTSEAATGTESFIIWGYQVEAGSFPTSYIPTSGSTVTRSADVMSITGTNFSRWYNNTEGTFFTNAILAFTQNAGNPFTFGGVFYTPVANVSGYLRTLANAEIMSGVLSTSLTSFSKTAVALKSGDYASAVSGSINGTSSLAYTPTGTEFRINSSLGSLALINRLTYYPTRLQNYQLQQLTK